MTQEAQKGHEDFGELKQRLRGYIEQRYPLEKDPSGVIGLKETQQKYFDAIETEDVDTLEELAHWADVDYSYWFSKDRARGNALKTLSEDIQKWVDAILAR